MKWEEVQENCEERIRDLVKKRENRLVRDIVTWSSTIESNENMRKIAIEAQGRKYGGKYLKIDSGQQGYTTYHISRTEHKKIHS